MNKFIYKSHAPINNQQQGYWFIFRNDEILIAKNENPIPYLNTIHSLNIDSNYLYLGTYQNKDCFGVTVANDFEAGSDFFWIKLRRAYDFLGDDFFKIAIRAFHVIYWDRIHQFCGQCANRLIMKQDERAKYCDKCDLLFYPKFSISIIVAITRGNEILLARSPYFLPGVYSVLSGYIESGETAEEAIKREVYEEVKLTVKNIHYFNSQLWPTPDTFMLGFLAEYESGDIQIDKKEIEDAAWFNLNHLPPLPQKASIAYQLINTVKNQMSKP